MHNLDIELKPSKIFIIFTSLSIFLAAMVVLQLTIPMWITTLLLLCIFIYGLNIIWTDGFLKSRFSILRFRTNTNGQWIFQNLSECMEGSLLKDSTVTRWICILRFKSEQKIAKKACLIFYDSLDRGLYRQLLLQLRCYHDDKTA